MIRKLPRVLIGSVLVLTASFSTVFAASANANKASANNCIKAFGHLIAPGWIKQHGSPSFYENCVLPRGIAKKLAPSGATTTPPTTPDTTNPTISNITITAGRNTAFIRWATDERADSAVYYGTTSPLSIESTSTKLTVGNVYVTSHEIQLSSLSASTTYYAIIRSRDESDNTTLSPQVTFTTTATATDTVAPVINAIVVTVGSTTATLTWRTNEDATGKVYYGTSSPVDTQASTTLSVGTTTLSRAHSFLLTGLATSTKYYYILESKDTYGNARKALEHAFTTASGI